MTVFEMISGMLRDRRIYCFAPVSLSECKITKSRLLERVGIAPEKGSAVMMAVPYAVNDGQKGNISDYAKSRDYHLFFAQLFDELLPVLRSKFPDYRFAGFADHSPIDEIHAAAIGGLGIIGRNGLVITENYSSLIFLGEIVTDAPIECQKQPVRHCEDCGLCLSACPVGCDKQRCLSAITQKKGELSEEEEALILENGSVWGCDTCQTVCPHTKKVYASGTVYSPIPFFSEGRIPFLTRRTVEDMTEDEFAERAYSWRGRGAILRNLVLFEEKSTDKQY